MRRLFFVIAGICLILFGAGITARAIGSHLPQPLRALFTDADGTLCSKPCLFGADRHGLYTLMQAHPSYHESAAYLSVSDSGWGSIRLTNLDTGVRRMDTPPMSSLVYSLTLGDLIMMFGAPVELMFQRQAVMNGMMEQVTFDFPNHRLCVVAQIMQPQNQSGSKFSSNSFSYASVLTPRTQLTMIALETDALDPNCAFYTRYAWRGFMAFARYRHFAPR